MLQLRSQQGLVWTQHLLKLTPHRISSLSRKVLRPVIRRMRGGFGSINLIRTWGWHFVWSTYWATAQVVVQSGPDRVLRAYISKGTTTAQVLNSFLLLLSSFFIRCRYSTIGCTYLRRYVAAISDFCSTTGPTTARFRCHEAGNLLPGPIGGQGMGYGKGDERARDRHSREGGDRWRPDLGPGDRVVPVHPQDYRLRATTWPWRFPRGPRGSELPRGGGDCGVVHLHQVEDRLGPPERPVRAARSRRRAVVLEPARHPGRVRAAVPREGLHPWASSGRSVLRLRRDPILSVR